MVYCNEKFVCAKCQISVLLIRHCFKDSYHQKIQCMILDEILIGNLFVAIRVDDFVIKVSVVLKFYL
jgi:hypothetical protein